MKLPIVLLLVLVVVVLGCTSSYTDMGELRRVDANGSDVGPVCKVGEFRYRGGECCPDADGDEDCDYDESGGPVARQTNTTARRL